MTIQTVIDMAAAQLCWECAETRPVYAHHTCETLDRIVNDLTEVKHLWCVNKHPQIGWSYCVESDTPGLCHQFESAPITPHTN
jgi:hypothetical protein